jgi:hypothetical protein
MSAPGISPDIRRFILTSISSVPHLEALLLLRNEPHAWNAARLAGRLYVSEKTAATLLGELVAAGIAQPESDRQLEYRYEPRSSELGGLLDQLAVTYTTHLVEITHLIHSKTDRKAQQFADAFKWRKDS